MRKCTHPTLKLFPRFLIYTKKDKTQDITGNENRIDNDNVTFRQTFLAVKDPFDGQPVIFVLLASIYRPLDGRRAGICPELPVVVAGKTIIDNEVFIVVVALVGLKVAETHDLSI